MFLRLFYIKIQLLYLYTEKENFKINCRTMHEGMLDVCIIKAKVLPASSMYTIRASPTI